MKAFRAKITSKNQLTLPAGVSAFLEAQPGDQVTFLIEDDGSVRVEGPSFAERVGPWVGRLAKRDGQTSDQIDAWVREIRGDRD